MEYRLAINGIGRIGKCLVRCWYQDKNDNENNLSLVAINECVSPEVVSYGLTYDSTYGKFPAQIAYVEPALIIAGHSVQIFNCPVVKELPWQTLDIDLLIDCSGMKAKQELAQQYLHAGAKKVLFSCPSDDLLDYTIINGYNHDGLQPHHTMVSNASCTSNCLIPILHTMAQALAIEYCGVTTLHAAMNDQPTTDTMASGKELRKTRAASQSMVPVSTQLAKGVEQLMPQLKGRCTTSAIRIPCLDVSGMYIYLNVAQTVNVADVNELLKNASEGALSGIIDYTEEPLVSRDLVGSTASAIVDGSQTQVTDKHHITLMAWFDNEWGFANRLLETAIRMQQLT